MLFQQSQVFPADRKQVWAVIQRPEFGQAMDEAAGIQSQLILEELRDGNPFTITAVTFNEPLPEIAAKFLGTSQLTWQQEQLWDEANFRLKWRILIPNMERKILAHGSYELLDSEESNSCVRQVSGEIIVRIPLLANKIERQIVRKLERSYERAGNFTERWLRGEDLS